MNSSLKIENLTTEVFLGVSDEEKMHPQKVQWNVEIHFSKMPQGCRSDNLNDTVCYNKLVNDINDLCQMGQYNLIEHLCYKVYNMLKAKLKEHTIIITVTKTLSGKLDYKSNFTIQDA